MRRRTYLQGIGGSLIGGAVALEVHSRGPSVSDQPFSEYGCPPFEGGTDWTPTVCSHTVDPDRADVYLLPSVDRTADPSELSFTLTNDSQRPLRPDPWDWALRRQGSDGWRAIEYTGGVASGSVEVPPGESRQWGAMEVADHFAGWNFDYPPGTYLAGIEVSDPGSGGRVRCAALFRILPE